MAKALCEGCSFETFTTRAFDLSSPVADGGKHHCEMVLLCFTFELGVVREVEQIAMLFI